VIKIIQADKHNIYISLSTVLGRSHAPNSLDGSALKLCAIQKYSGNPGSLYVASASSDMEGRGSNFRWDYSNVKLPHSDNQLPSWKNVLANKQTYIKWTI
jgi:hypothetical protein